MLRLLLILPPSCPFFGNAIGSFISPCLMALRITGHTNCGNKENNKKKAASCCCCCCCDFLERCWLLLLLVGSLTDEDDDGHLLKRCRDRWRSQNGINIWMIVRVTCVRHLFLSSQTEWNLKFYFSKDISLIRRKSYTAKFTTDPRHEKYTNLVVVVLSCRFWQSGAIFDPWRFYFNNGRPIWWNPDQLTYAHDRYLFGPP